MRFFILLCGAACALAGCAPQAGNGPAPLTAAQVAHANIDNQAAINRILDLMNSPDPVVRVSGLQQGLRSEDRNLRQLALSMAFASNIPALRNGALLGAMATSHSLPIRFVSYTTRNHSLSDKIGDSLFLYISHATNSSNEFRAGSDYSSSKRDSSGNKLEVYTTGTVADGSLRFGVELYEVGDPDCEAVLTLDAVGATLHGTLTCNRSKEAYIIASSALN